MDNRLFKIEDGEVSLAGTTFKYPKIIPSSGGVIDILRNFNWKHSITKNATSEVPSIRLKEYTLAYGKWMQNIVNAFTNAGNAVESSGQKIDPYAFLYTGVPTGFQYRIPNLIQPGNSLKGSINNNWEKVDLLQIASKLPEDLGGKFFQGVSKIEKGVEDFFGNMGYEQLRSFRGTASRTIQISFPLYNTVDINSTIQNFRFVQLFALQNLKVRTTYLTYLPPKIYEVITVERGGPYMAAAFVSKFDVYSIGATRSIMMDGGYTLIPEAYKVAISLTELMDPSANVDAGSIEYQRRVTVINPRTDIDAVQVGTNIAKEGIDIYERAVKAITGQESQ